MVWHKDLTAGNNNLRLEGTGGHASSGSGYIETPTSTLINLEAGGGNISGSGTNYICYAWTGIEGFSKFGSYIGNGDADGPFIYLGFKPALVIFKEISGSGESWSMLDNKRNTYNPTSKVLWADTTGSEQDHSINNTDFLSNGVKIRSADNRYNDDTEKYIYMAWAEMPLKYATAR